MTALPMRVEWCQWRPLTRYIYFFRKERVTAVHSHAGKKHNTTRVAVTQRNSPLSLLSPSSLPFLFLPFPFPSLPFPSLPFPSLSRCSPNPLRLLLNTTWSAECDWGRVGSYGFIQVQGVEEGMGGRSGLNCAHRRDDRRRCAARC